MTYPIKSPRKLIEVALPLDAINAAAVREGFIYKGNPSAIHKWWAQRPLAVARAVIFAQLVNDPGYQQGGGFRHGMNKTDAAMERRRLFKIIEDLVIWENSNNEQVLAQAREEIRRSWREVCHLNRNHPAAAELFNPEVLPGLLDPFAGGGTIPLEAQRLGLAPIATDLNPVAVLINKALIEIPPRFMGRAPVGPEDSGAQPHGRLAFSNTWPGVTGLAEDVRRYSAWMHQEAIKRIGHLYQPIEVTAAMATDRPDLVDAIGKRLTVLGWLWARTVKSPNPAFSHIDVPLVSTFIISSKTGKESYLEPIVDESGNYRFAVKRGTPPPGAENGTKAKGRGSNFHCLVSNVAISGDYIKAEGVAGRMGTRMLAIVAAGERGRIYLAPTETVESLAHQAAPSWAPDLEINGSTQFIGVRPYGIEQFSQLFTARQLLALTTLSDLVAEARARATHDAIDRGMDGDAVGLHLGGDGATAYAEAVSTYLAFALSKTSEYSSTSTVWYAREDRPKGLFARQAIPMVWDFAEQNILGDIGGSFTKSAQIVADSLAAVHPLRAGTATQVSAATASQTLHAPVFISTDPPYYDNIPYADLSDYFYVWLRRSLAPVFPELFKTRAVPKSEELVAFAYRHGSAEAAEQYFLSGMTEAMSHLASRAHPEAPVTIYYAFKQSDTEKSEGTSSTGWETFLDAVFRAGLQLTGTWPMRTERESRSRGLASNALASSIVLVCRKRPADAATISRREYIRELNTVLPAALDEMTKGAGDERAPVAAVDLSQAIIGPGMAVFSKHAAVLEADGSAMSVRTALQLINRFLAEDDFDADTQFCLHWFEQNGWRAGAFGDADTLARAKGTAVAGVKAAGVVASGGGTVRLLKWTEYESTWDPRTDTRNPIWETLHHLIRALKNDGESGAGRLLASVRDKAEPARQLAYRLYTLCERQGWAEDARAYNELITSWAGVESAAGTASTEPAQRKLFD